MGLHLVFLGQHIPDPATEHPKGAIESLLLLPVPLLLFAVASSPKSLSKASSETSFSGSLSFSASPCIVSGGSTSKSACMSPWTENPREKSHKLARLLDLDSLASCPPLCPFQRDLLSTTPIMRSIGALR